MLRDKTAATDDGDHAAGLKAVLLHIETAFAHYSRGETSGDDTAFTDAIYRSNQAFEGSVKEAYRVLTGNDPAKKTPFEIEKYLEEHQILRRRVLEQLSNYRSQWRNPSTHDYKLDFDQSESLFAIVSVAAFAAMLIEEIQQKLAFNKSQAEAEAAAAAAATADSANGSDFSFDLPSEKIELVQEVRELLNQFCSLHLPVAVDGKAITESQSIGAIMGFLASAAPHLQARSEVQIGSASVDLVVSRNGESVFIEIKRRLYISDVPRNLTQLERYLELGKQREGVLLYLPDLPSELEVIPFAVSNAVITIMAPPGFIKTSESP
ncbi:hypothetical protein [Variovorax sp. OAS795]|uniref:hypothetical protein n=1 Tax=Variovorax sp. OAS795 TaxID=3034231 RepID=UPI003399BC27